MSWFNTLLNIGSAAMDVANYNRLSQLQKQGEADQQIQQILQILRDQAFNFRQSAEDILAQYEDNPRVAAGAMRLLAIRLFDSPIEPDIFPNLQDKEYVASTIRFINNQTNRLMQALEPQEQVKVEQMIANGQNLSDANFYLENYGDAEKLLNAEETYLELETRNSRTTRMIVAAGLIFLMIVSCMLSASVQNFTLMGLLFLAAIGGGIAWRIYMRSGDYNKAKKVIKELDDDVDLDRFHQLDLKFEGDRDNALNQKNQMEAAIDLFFNTPSSDEIVQITEENKSSSTRSDDVEPSIAVSMLPIEDDESRQSSSQQSAYFSCPVCNFNLHQGVKVCGNCGSSLDSSETVSISTPTKEDDELCNGCGSHLPSGASFCPSCGYEI